MGSCRNSVPKRPTATAIMKTSKAVRSYYVLPCCLLLSTLCVAS